MSCKYIFTKQSVHYSDFRQMSLLPEEVRESLSLPSPSHSNSGNVHYFKYVVQDNVSKKVWQCRECLKEFKYKYTLVRHLPVHTDERKYKCDHCQQSFRQQSTLAQHKASKHSKIKPYVCEICEKSFSRASILINHKKIHADKKPFKCEYCEKAFFQKINMKIHLNIHTNARPYNCDQCGKRFNQRSNLTTHKRKCLQKIQNTKDETLENVENVENEKKSKLLEITSERVDPKSGSEEVVTESGSQARRGGQALLGQQSALIVGSVATPEYSRARQTGQTPFALFQPSRGPRLIVKVQRLAGGKHLLVPTAARDFQLAGAGLLQVPVVALIQQTTDPLSGRLNIQVSSPAAREESENCLTEEHTVVQVTETGEIILISPQPPDTIRQISSV